MHPVLVPKSVQDLSVQLALEDLVRHLVVLVSVQPEILELLARDQLRPACVPLVFLHLSSFVVLVGAEASNLDLASGHRAFGVDDNCDAGVLEFLHALLCVDVNAREPAAVPRVRVVPTTDVFRPVHQGRLVLMVQGKLVGLLASIHASLSAFHGQTEGVHHVHGVALGISLHEPHDFNVATALGMHHHFDQGDGTDLDFLEMVGVFLPLSLHQELLDGRVVEVVNLFIFHVVLKLKSLLSYLRLIHLHLQFI